MKICHLVFACAVLSWAGAATAKDASPPLNSDPDWAKRPSAEDLVAVWPKAALASGRGGKTTLHCKVSRHGALYDCSVVSESPTGAGFGEAGLILTRQFLMRPARRNGQEIDGAEVSIPLVFPPFTPVRDGSDMFGAQSVLSIGRWIEAPSYSDVAAAYPDKARAKGIGGHVSLNCTLKADGHLRFCDKILAEPDGMGFDAAAKQLALKFVAPSTVDGKTVKGMITQVAFAFSPAMLSAEEPEIGKPRWTALPTGEQMISAFPDSRASTKASTVRVKLSCLIVAGGKMEDCKVLSEDPAGEGFGAAAVGVSKYFEVSTWSEQGLPTVGGRVQIPIRYELGPPAPSAEKPPG
jgi:TonB family protein